MSMGWQESEITIHRSAAHYSTWCANLPGSDVRSIIDSAGPLRACQRWVVESAPLYGYQLGTRVKWRKDNTDSFSLLVWAEASESNTKGH